MMAPDDLDWLVGDAVITIGQAVRRITRLFGDRGFWGPSQDARALVGHATGLSYSSLVLRADDQIGPEVRDRLAGYVRRRFAHEPVGRILASRFFRGLDLEVSPATLEPREDTEVLVEAGLAFLATRASDAGALTPVIADIGTGTGAIAIAMLAGLPDAFAVAVDISAEALATACRNARRHGVHSRFAGFIGHYGEALAESRFNLILSNPPYIATEEIATLEPDVRNHDPHLALDGGADGLDAYRAIVPAALASLKPGGALMVEIGHLQGADVSRLFVQAGFSDVAVTQDPGARDRVVSGYRPKELLEKPHALGSVAH